MSHGRIRVEDTNNPEVYEMVIEAVHVMLDSHAMIQVLALAFDGTELYTKHVQMDGADYENWTTVDDPYIQDFVTTALGFNYPSPLEEQPNTPTLSEAEEQDGYQDGYQ